MTTMDQIHRIRELFYEQGKNLNEIAIIMNCDWRTVRKYVDMEVNITVRQSRLSGHLRTSLPEA